MTQKHQRAVSLLTNFGLSSNEAAVYTYLLERGEPTGGSNIAYATELHRQYVYTSLKKLSKQGLIETVSRGHHNHYKALAPTQIKKIAQRRLLDADETVRELNTFSAVGHEQDFDVLQGEREIQQYEMDYVRRVAENEEEYIIGGNVNGFEQVMGDVLDEYTGIKDKKHMNVLYVGSKNCEVERYRQQTSFNPRFLKNFPQGQTHVVVRKDTVHFFSFLTPPLVYVIKSRVVAKDYKHFFMMLWDMAG